MNCKYLLKIIIKDGLVNTTDKFFFTTKDSFKTILTPFNLYNVKYL